MDFFVQAVNVLQILVYGNSGFVDLKNKFAGLINFISHSFGLINNE